MKGTVPAGAEIAMWHDSRAMPNDFNFMTVGHSIIDGKYDQDNICHWAVNAPKMFTPQRIKGVASAIPCRSSRGDQKEDH
jgi:hypothetical protein